MADQPIGELVNHDLKLELLVRELSTQTSNGGINWSSTGNGSFETNKGGFNYCLFFIGLIITIILFDGHLQTVYQKTQR